MKRKSLKIKVLSLALAVTMAFSGCTIKGKDKKGTNNGIDDATKQIQENDYHGGVTRALALKTAILNIIDGMKENNNSIRQANPNDFWTQDGYQDFVSTFLNIGIINDTSWFNEEYCEWATTLDFMLYKHSAPAYNAPNDEGGYTPYKDIKLSRYEKNDYGITGTSATIMLNSRVQLYSGETYYKCLYDSDKDWVKAYASFTTALENVQKPLTAQLFEYGRIDSDHFVMQTSAERIYVVLEPEASSEGGIISDLRQRKIKEFYYSKLAEGSRTTFEPYELQYETPDPLVAEDNENYEYIKSVNSTFLNNPHVNALGDLDMYYGVNDSVFLNDVISKISPEWVFADKNLKQAMSYKDGALVVTTYNKLSDSYERFIYASENVTDSLVSELEAQVKMDELGAAVNEMKVSVREALPEGTEVVEDNPIDNETLEKQDMPEQLKDDEGNVIAERGDSLPDPKEKQEEDETETKEDDKK